jgi:transposase
MLGLIPPSTAARIFLYAKHLDMRKSFDGLHGIIQAEFHMDVRRGDLFLFLNRRLDRVKLIWWDRDGLVIFYKRLEAGTYQRPAAAPDSNHVLLDATDLALLLSGIDLRSAQRRKRYRLDPTRTVDAAPVAP